MIEPLFHNYEACELEVNKHFWKTESKYQPNSTFTHSSDNKHTLNFILDNLYMTSPNLSLMMAHVTL